MPALLKITTRSLNHQEFGKLLIAIEPAISSERRKAVFSEAQNLNLDLLRWMVAKQLKVFHSLNEKLYFQTRK
jgi:hypothetical protein